MKKIEIERKITKQKKKKMKGMEIGRKIMKVQGK